MKIPLMIVVLALILSGCTSLRLVKDTDDPFVKKHARRSHSSDWPYGLGTDRWSWRDSESIKSRARSYEAQGHKPEEAKAMAEVEYLQSAAAGPRSN